MEKRVKVKIERDEVSGTITITGVDPLPSLEDVTLFLPAGKRTWAKRSRGYYDSLPRVIQRTGGTIRLQEWSDAIAEAAMVRMANARGASTELKTITQGAYLAMGDMVYKLSPVEQAPQAKALAVARKKVMDVARDEAKRLLLRARMNAKHLTEKAAQARREAAQVLERAQKEAGSRPPTWAQANGLTMRWYNDVWEIRMDANLTITGFDYDWTSFRGDVSREKQYTWGALPGHYYQVDFWVPIDLAGRVSISSIKVVGRQYLPHVDGSASCMAPGDAPAEVKNFNDWLRLRESVCRTMSRVNLASLRVSVVDWLEFLKPSIPTDLYEALKKHKSVNDVEILGESLWVLEESADSAKEGRTTWSLET